MRDGYSWITNVQHGVGFFNGDKKNFAIMLENLWMKLFPQLPTLTPAQAEQDTLIEYGDSPAIFSASKQTVTTGAYWVPDPGTNNTTWMINNHGNPRGVAYADYVLKNIQH